MVAVGENAQCPSISPNGKLIAYKKRRADSQPAQGTSPFWTLPRGPSKSTRWNRRFDDQREWLDSSTLLFGQPRTDNPGDADISP